MAQGGVLGNGVRVGYALASASPMVWTRVKQVIDVKFPTFAVDKIDTTVHSTSKFKRHMPGMADVNAMELTLLQDLDETTGTDQDEFWTLNQSSETIYWRIEVPTERDQTKYTPFEFQGYVGTFEPGTPIMDKQTLKVVVEFDGTTFDKKDNTSSPAIS